MSYCRFADGDVYLVPTNGKYACMRCRLDPEGGCFSFETIRDVKDHLEEHKAAGHKVVVVTNHPYIEGTTKEADAVVCNFSGTPDSIRISAGVLFGKIKPSASTKMPVKLKGQKAAPTKKLKAPKKHPLNLSYC